MNAPITNKSCLVLFLALFVALFAFGNLFAADTSAPIPNRPIDPVERAEIVGLLRDAADTALLASQHTSYFVPLYYENNGRTMGLLNAAVTVKNATDRNAPELIRLLETMQAGYVWAYTYYAQNRSEIAFLYGHAEGLKAAIKLIRLALTPPPALIFNYLCPTEQSRNMAFTAQQP